MKWFNKNKKEKSKNGKENKESVEGRLLTYRLAQ